jgi:hypothetical protein
MRPDSDAMRLLIERLLGDGQAWFKAEELDVILSWLAGSQRHGGDALTSRIGPASEQTGRRIAVYDRVSAQLFRDGQLDLAGAHVDIDIGDEARRGRYRRLMTAFHPDRFPEHADWLTSRSQAVLASYARFRKGEGPESRSPDEPRVHRPGQAAARKPARPEWPRERRSARLTPNRGPGPLTQLRVWLLGIENLQQRILVVLGAVCLIPVIYAYLAYKPYRDISSSEPVAVVEQDDGRESPSGATGDEKPEEMATRTAAPEPARTPQPPATELHSSEDAAEATDQPTEATRTAAFAWMERLAESAGNTLIAASGLIDAIESYQAPAAAKNPAADDAPMDDSRPASETAPPPAEVQIAKALADAAPEPAMEDNPAPDRAATGPATAEPSSEASRNAAGEPARPVEPVRPIDESTLAVVENEAPTAQPKSEPSARSREASTPRQTASPAVAQSRSDKPDTPQAPPAGETAPAVPEAPDAESDVAAAQADQAEDFARIPREHIEALLSGYRTSFENGWLEDFLDHFTAEPRENAHRGRGWFRSNYGWLFENTEERRLNIDIVDISRAHDHWVAVARFEMQVDYPDRPATRSTRRVRYTIEANEHDQLRIAAIEY